jgi:uncharacterized repeat protein (TIGR01451 family)
VGAASASGGGGGSSFPATATITTAALSTASEVAITYTLPTADLSITKSGPATAPQGVPFSYTLTVTNGGPDTATGVTVTDTLPAGVTFDSAPGCTQAAGTVTCTVASLANLGTATFTVTVTPTTTSGTLSNSASVSATEFDPHLGNNTSAAVSTTVLAGSTACATTGDNRQAVTGGGTGLVSIATHVEPRTTDHPGTSFRDEVCIDDASGADDAAGVPAPTGTLTFFLCTPTQVAGFGCPVGVGTQVGKPQKVKDADQMIKSPAAKPKALGTYCWLVHYSGDAHFAPADSTNSTTECFTVTASKHR